jgi:hypothetical protein
LITTVEIIHGSVMNSVVDSDNIKLHVGNNVFSSSFLFKYMKVNVVPGLPLTEHHAMKAYWGSGSTAPPIL